MGCRAGVLTEIKQGRDRLFLNRRLLALLTGPGEQAQHPPSDAAGDPMGGRAQQGYRRT